MKEVPIWEKTNLTLEEAAAYSGIGINKLREITNNDRCDFVLWVGTKRLCKEPCKLQMVPLYDGQLFARRYY